MDLYPQVEALVDDSPNGGYISNLYGSSGGILSNLPVDLPTIMDVS